ncbi:hypothetical protein [Gordonia phthalatica]|uniref:hypothetical protein n=1 Tax=Gordonia phthalatica TaxID=1136941 RepID=UPI0012FE944B|nr:hypothetical protein [Gordonia phthalatica]
MKVTYRGSTTVYSMQGARLKNLALNWISGFTSDRADDFIGFEDTWREQRLR